MKNKIQKFFKTEGYQYFESALSAFGGIWDFGMCGIYHIGDDKSVNGSCRRKERSLLSDEFCFLICDYLLCYVCTVYASDFS